MCACVLCTCGDTFGHPTICLRLAPQRSRHSARCIATMAPRPEVPLGDYTSGVGVCDPCSSSDACAEGCEGLQRFMHLCHAEPAVALLIIQCLGRCECRCYQRNICRYMRDRDLGGYQLRMNRIVDRCPLSRSSYSCDGYNAFVRAARGYDFTRWDPLTPLLPRAGAGELESPLADIE